MNNPALIFAITGLAGKVTLIRGLRARSLAYYWLWLGARIAPQPSDHGQIARMNSESMSKTEVYLERFMSGLKRRNPGESEFHQAVSGRDHHFPVHCRQAHLSQNANPGTDV